MTCTTCGRESSPDFAFCPGCGSPLSRTCPSCSHVNAPDHAFCSSCGASLAAPVQAEADGDAPTTEQRRMVSALFADLVGFTPFSEGRDPEEVRSMLTDYFDRAQQIVERFGGVVDKYTGDAVTAFWGATTVQEDDAERAVRAALELVDMVAVLGAEIGADDLQLRAGVLTGETAVGPGGNEKGLVVGDVVNTAARLQSIAEPGTVAVGESTARLATAAIDFEDIGPHELKGKAEPVTVYRALRVVAERGGRNKADQLEPPFVGRDIELRMLKDQLHAVMSDETTRLVSIVGEAGIGKSRLVWELLKYVDGLADLIHWHQGRSPAYGEGLTFWALGEMVRRRAGIAENDDEQRSRIRLRTAVAEFIEDPDEQRWVEPRLAGLLGLAEMPSGERADLYGALRIFFQRVAERAPAVLIFEDLHAADVGLLTFIEELIDQSARHPILVVTLARPELLDRRPGWGSGHRHSVSVHVGPLSTTDMEDLVRGVGPDMDDTLVGSVVDRADGVPLFAVEFLRTLINEGVLVREGDSYRSSGATPELSVPDSVRAVIAARLDRLSDDEQELLEDASVLGEAFSMDGLHVLRPDDELEAALATLVRKEILTLEADPRSPERGQYRFLQTLIREIAYGRMTKARRRDRHVAVADHYESLANPQVAVAVATHLLAARHAAPDEAHDLSARARRALVDAAQRALSLHSHEQAFALAEQSIELCESDAEVAESSGLAARAGKSVPEQREAAVAHGFAAVEAGRSSGDPQVEAAALAILGTTLNDTLASEHAVEELTKPVEAMGFPDTAAEAGVVASLARAHMLAGTDFREAARLADLAAGAAEKNEDLVGFLEALITRGTALTNLGRNTEAAVLLKGALEVAEANDLPLTQLRAANNSYVVLWHRDQAAAVETVVRHLDLAQRIGEPDFLGRIVGISAWSRVRQGRLDDARDLIEAIDLGQLPRFNRIFVESVLSTIELLRGDLAAGAAGLLEWTEGYLNQRGSPMDRLYAYDYQSENELLAGRFEAVLSLAEHEDRSFLGLGPIAGAIAAVCTQRHDLLTERWTNPLPRGPRRAGLAAFVDGASLCFDGRVDDAAPRMEFAHEAWARTSIGLERAYLDLGIAAAMGEHPLAAAARQALWEFIDSSGAVNLAETWAPVIGERRSSTAEGLTA